MGHRERTSLTGHNTASTPRPKLRSAIRCYSRQHREVYRREFRAAPTRSRRGVSRVLDHHRGCGVGVAGNRDSASPWAPPTCLERGRRSGVRPGRSSAHLPGRTRAVAGIPRRSRPAARHCHAHRAGIVQRPGCVAGDMALRAVDAHPWPSAPTHRADRSRRARPALHRASLIGWRQAPSSGLGPVTAARHQ